MGGYRYPCVCTEMDVNKDCLHPLPSGYPRCITMTNPDPESSWLLFGPLNALIHGGVAYTLWLLLVGDDDNSAASKDGPDRPRDL
jgi:hypothetical protein